MLKNLYHKPWVQKIRTFARWSGVLSLVNKLNYGNNVYEQNFNDALEKAVKPGDVIWDIGANIGVYTKKFLDWTGDDGKVVAFEPFPKAFERLQQELMSHAYFHHAVVKNIALSNKCGDAFFSSAPDDAISTTEHLIDDAHAQGGIKVNVSTADVFMLEERESQPNVVKIDVEGYEEEVLEGGKTVFSSPDCRHILVEMHFSRMAERKLGNCASRIAALLKKWGYTLEWVDASHIHAYRL